MIISSASSITGSADVENTAVFSSCGLSIADVCISATLARDKPPGPNITGSPAKGISETEI